MIYFDYAATTPILPEVKNVFIDTLEQFGNPSSVHLYGRKSRVIVEEARAIIAELLSCEQNNIIFTSSATEAINLGITSICRSRNIKNIIFSPIEHAAMLRSIAFCSQSNNISTLELKINNLGNIDLDYLEKLLQTNANTLVCIMHANNEIGNLIPIKEIGKLCKTYNALFFCDMVQTMGKYNLALNKLPIDFAVGSAHKFYGPKGCGLFYITEDIDPLLFGGFQERNMRAGTENIPAIVATAKALEIIQQNLSTYMLHINEIKQYCITKLKNNFPDIVFVGNCENGGVYHIINFFLPNINSETLFMHLDMRGIAVSSGSACSSGSQHNSHVLQALGINKKSIRISFGKDNTFEEIDIFIHNLLQIYNAQNEKAL